MFGKYQLLKKIGTGGMAELFLAKQPGIEGFEKFLVIKRILPHLADAEQFIEMFLDEARLAAQLNHPNIVQIYDLDRVKGQYFIAMEYVNGVDLSRILKREHKLGGKLPITHAVKILSYVCEALAYAHTRTDVQGNSLNLVHRDISPQNVLVAFDGGVKLTDFGIAKASSRASETKTGSLKGKYSYMSPEQCLGNSIDLRSDIFAAGILLYQMTTGELPFTGDSEFSAMNSIVNEPQPVPTVVREDFPEALVGILERALAKDPQDRFPDALSFQMSLESFLVEKKAVSSTTLIGQYMRDLFKDVIAAQAKASSDGKSTIEGILTSLSITPTGPDASSLKTAIREEEPAAPEMSLADQPTYLFEAPAGEGPTARRSIPILITAVFLSALLAVLAVHLLGKNSGDQDRAPAEPVSPAAVVAAPQRQAEDGGSSKTDVEAGTARPAPTGMATTAAQDGGMKKDAGHDPAKADHHQRPKRPKRKAKSMVVSAKKQVGKKTKKGGKKLEKATEKASVGFLTMDSRPWSEVWFSGKKLGLTPLAYKKLPTGRHKLILRNRQLGIEKTVWIHIKPGKTTVIEVDLKK